jgi:hypothetical protein
MRAVIYARFSSELQRDASIQDQIRLCRVRIEQEGWKYLHAYTDRAVSGASALRPAYQSLLEDARRGAFDIVVAEALDRLSRDQEDVAGLFKRLRFAGIRLFTLAEGEISELHVGLKGTMNALFLKDLAERPGEGSKAAYGQGDRAGVFASDMKSFASTIFGASRSMAGARSTSPKPRSCAASLPSSRPASHRVGSPSTSTGTMCPAHAVANGITRQSTETPPAARVSSTTNSISAASSGTGCATSKIRRRVGVSPA